MAEFEPLMGGEVENVTIRANDETRNIDSLVSGETHEVSDFSTKVTVNGHDASTHVSGKKDNITVDVSGSMGWETVNTWYRDASDTYAYMPSPSRLSDNEKFVVDVPSTAGVRVDREHRTNDHWDQILFRISGGETYEYTNDSFRGEFDSRWWSWGGGKASGSGTITTEKKRRSFQIDNVSIYRNTRRKPHTSGRRGCQWHC